MTCPPSLRGWPLSRCWVLSVNAGHSAAGSSSVWLWSKVGGVEAGEGHGGEQSPDPHFRGGESGTDSKAVSCGGHMGGRGAGYMENSH